AASLAGALAVADGIRRGFDPVRARHVLMAAALLAATAGAVLVWRRIGRARAPDAARGVAAAVAVVLLAAGGYEVQLRFNDNRYRHLEAPLAWVREDAHRRVGLAGLSNLDGIYPVFPAFGPRLGNHVEFVGPFRDEMLVEYRDRRAFAAALRRGGYDLLIVGNAVLPGTPRGDVEGWARAGGYVPVVRSHRLVLLRRAAAP
ncbi:MAG TPA: hypothetical protein VNB64_09215, partial [Solirubrobacteraceae bacterium]|nr:hypothetical protein [Solirubrobacteraceae bacterium]